MTNPFPSALDAASSPWSSTFTALYGLSDAADASAAQPDSFAASRQGLMPPLSYAPGSLAAAADPQPQPAAGYSVASGVVRAWPAPKSLHRTAETLGGACAQTPARMPPPPLRTENAAPHTMPVPSTDTAARRVSPQLAQPSSPTPFTSTTVSPAVFSDTIHSSAQRLNASSKSAASALSAVYRHTWSASSGGGGGATHASGRAPVPRHTRAPVADTPSSLGDATAAAVDLDSSACCVMALLDNGHHEIGVAMCTLPSFAFSISQFSDTYTFARCVSLISARNPVELLVPHTAVREECTQTLLGHFAELMTFTSVQRRFFNAEEGVARLHTLRSTDDTTVAVDDTDQYLCVAAASALLTYMEQLQGMAWLPHTLRLAYMHLDQSVSLSRSTARALRLIPDPTSFSYAVSGAAADDPNGRAAGLHRHVLEVVPLVDALPRACTMMGQRMVRTSLLQPLRDLNAITNRLDAVAWLLHDPTRFMTLRRSLSRLARLDIEQLLASFLWRTGPLLPAKQRQLLQCLVRVWESLEVLLVVEQQLTALLGPVTADTTTAGTTPVGGDQALASATAAVPVPSLLREIQRTLAACQLDGLHATTCLYLDPTVREASRAGQARDTAEDDDASRGGRGRVGGGSRAGETLFEHLRTFFTVYATAGSALDVARTRFTQQVDAIVQYSDALRQRYDLRTLRLEPDTEKLYCLSYAVSEDAKAPNHVFRYKYTGGQHFALYTEALKRQQEKQNQRETVESDVDAVTHAQWEAATSIATNDRAHASAATTSTAERRQRRRQGHRRVRCSTDELEGLCRAAERYSAAILIEEVEGVQGLLDTLRRLLGRLQAMGEAIALLDLLLTFCGYTTLRRCVRPSWSSLDAGGSSGSPIRRSGAETAATTSTFSTETAQPRAEPSTPAVALLQLRHPSARPPTPGALAAVAPGHDALRGRESVGRRRTTWASAPAVGTSLSAAASLSWLGTANDVTWPAGARTLLVTGPNAAGKSTLLEMVGQCFVLAQAGCFVPAASARLFLTDVICAHMLCDGLPSVGTSCFHRELVELAAITSAVTSQSLVLMDELGRSTRTSQGFTLAWSTLLFLRRHRVHSLSTTHFIGLTRLAEGFDDVANVHFTTTTTAAAATATVPSGALDGEWAPPRRLETPPLASAAATTGTVAPLDTPRLPRRTFLHCSHVLLPGVCPVSEYGLELARHIGFHEGVLDLAERLREAERVTVPTSDRLVTSPDERHCACSAAQHPDEEGGATTNAVTVAATSITAPTSARSTESNEHTSCGSSPTAA